MEKIHRLQVSDESIGVRIDLFIKDEINITRSAAQHLIDGGNVFVNGAVRGKNYPLRKGDVIDVHIPPPEMIETEPQEISLDIVYQDDCLAVINKPQGMVVHPAAGNRDSTLVNALLFHMRDSLSGINGAIRPGIVHRIDKNTSGLLVIAKNDIAHECLAAQIKAHEVSRIYRAIAVGTFREEQGSIDKALGRSRTDRKKMAVYADGASGSKRAVTHYRVLSQNEGRSYLELELETGRTHQIRVHLASIGHPIIGDDVYGGRRMHEGYPQLEGQCLHAAELRFVHPLTGELMSFQSPLPQYFTAALEKYDLLIGKEEYINGQI